MFFLVRFLLSDEPVRCKGKERKCAKEYAEKKCKIDTGKIMYNIKIRQQSIILRSIAILTLVIVLSTFIIVLINF